MVQPPGQGLTQRKTKNEKRKTKNEQLKTEELAAAFFEFCFWF
jgi:hypothetical protein